MVFLETFSVLFSRLNKDNQHFAFVRKSLKSLLLCVCLCVYEQKSLDIQHATYSHIHTTHSTLGNVYVVSSQCVGKKREQVGLICGKTWHLLFSCVNSSRSPCVFTPRNSRAFLNQTSEWGSPLQNKTLLTILLRHSGAVSRIIHQT